MLKSLFFYKSLPNVLFVPCIEYLELRAGSVQVLWQQPEVLLLQVMVKTISTLVLSCVEGRV